MSKNDHAGIHNVETTMRTGRDTSATNAPVTQHVLCIIIRESHQNIRQHIKHHVLLLVETQMVTHTFA